MGSLVKTVQSLNPNPAVIPVSLRDLSFILFKRKWEMAAVFLLTMIAAFVYIFLIRDTVYRTSVSLLVKMGQEQAPPTTMLEDRPLLVDQRPQDVNTEIAVLLSQDLLAQVVDDLKLYEPTETPVPEDLFPWLKHKAKATLKGVKDWYNNILVMAGMRTKLPPREEALAMLSQSLEVEPQLQSDVIVASLYVPQREGGNLILDALIERYLAYRATVYRDVHSVDYFNRLVTEAEARLRKAEEEIAAFEAANNIQDITQQETSLLARLADTAKQWNEAQIRLRQAELKADKIPEIGSGDAAAFTLLGAFEVDSFPEHLMTELSVIMRERVLLSTEGSQSSTRLAKIDQERDVIVAMLKNHILAVEQERREEFEQLGKLHDELQAQLQAVHNQQEEWRRLNRAVSVAENSYLYYLDKLEEASAVAAMQESNIGNVAVIQNASIPLFPEGVSKSKLLMIAFAFAVFAALAWAAVREFFDHGIYTPDQLRKHGRAPVIAVVPGR